MAFLILASVQLWISLLFITLAYRANTITSWKLWANHVMLMEYRDWKWRVEMFHKTRIDNREMLLKFWRPVASFYPKEMLDKNAVEPGLVASPMQEMFKNK